MTPFVVPEGSTATIAVLLRGALGCSHREAKELVLAGRAHVNGVAALDVAARPRGGAEISLAPEGAPRPKRPLEGPGFRVVHIDEWIVVADKEPGIVTVPTANESPEDPPLVARLLGAMATAGHWIREGLWVVHRIDRSTSGLVLFARAERIAEELRAQFFARTPLREYVAWTEGIPAPPRGELSHVLAENEKSRRVYVARSGEEGKDARLEYEVEAQTSAPAPRARVRARLVTGRRNQIRVQFSAAGWPILGDRFYGASDDGPGRTALHAARLGFVHPGLGAPVEYEAPWPADLVKLDRRLFAQRSPTLRRRR